MNKEYVDYLKKVSEQLDKHHAQVLLGIGIVKCVGLCHAISCVDGVDKDRKYRVLLLREIDKVRWRKNVFYGYQTGKTDDDMQFLWHPSNYKVRKKFLAGLINKELDK